MDTSEKSSTVESKLKQKFTIPKIKRDSDKVCIIQCKPERREYAEIMDILNKGRLNMACELNSSWEFSQVKLVLNSDLERRFSEKRNEMKELGRTMRELEEKYCFLMVSYQSAETICNNGISVENMAKKVLGNPHMGTYLFRHVDVALNVTHQKNLTSHVMVVFKVLFGKVRKVCSVSPKKMELDPTPNFDSHVSKQPPSWGDPFDEQVKNSLIYVYEYDNRLKPVKTPRQCLPIALVTTTFLSQKMTLPTARLPSKPVSSGSDALANCTVAQRIGKGRDATVIFHSVRTPENKPSLREISQNSSLKNETPAIPVVNRNQKFDSHSAPETQNQISLPNFCVPPNLFSMSLDSLIMSSIVISSQSIKDPRLLKRCEQEFGRITTQYLLGQQIQKQFAFENEMSTLKDKDPSKENLGNLENSGSKTSPYLSFEEARFSYEKYMTKEQKIKTIDNEAKTDYEYLTEQQREVKCTFDNYMCSVKEKGINEEREYLENNISKTSLSTIFEATRKPSSFLTTTENVEGADTQPLQYLPMEEKSELSKILCENVTPKTPNKNQLGGSKDTVSVTVNSSLENAFSPSKSVNLSKYPAKIKGKNHLPQINEQLLSSRIKIEQIEESNCRSQKLTQKNVVHNVVLHNSRSNQRLFSEKQTEDKSAKVSTEPEALQSHQNSISDIDKKVCSDSNINKPDTTKARVKTSLASSKDNLKKDVEAETCKSNVKTSLASSKDNLKKDVKAETCKSKNIADNAHSHMHLSNSPFYLNEVSTEPEALQSHQNSISDIDKKVCSDSNINKPDTTKARVKTSLASSKENFKKDVKVETCKSKKIADYTHSHMHVSNSPFYLNEVSTETEALQSNQNSISDIDKKVCSDSNINKPDTTKARVKTSLASSKENLKKDVKDEICKSKKIADNTHSHMHLSNSPIYLNEVSTEPEALQSHQNSISDIDKKVCSDNNIKKLDTSKARVKTSLASSKENLKKDIKAETCKSKKIADNTHSYMHVSNSPFYLNEKSPKTAEKCLVMKNPERKAPGQHFLKNEKVESATTVHATSPKKIKEGDNATSSLAKDRNAKHQISGPIHKDYNDTNENESSSKCSLLYPLMCTSKQDEVVETNVEIDLVTKNLNVNCSVAKLQAEKMNIPQSLSEKSLYDDTHFDSLCMTQLEGRIDWKGIFGMEKEKAEEMAELQKPSRKLKEPSGLRIFPDMEITIRNSHYVCKEQEINSFVKVYSSKAVKENINDNFKIDVSSDLKTSSTVSETVINKISPMSQVCDAQVDNKPDLLSHSVGVSENSVLSDRKTITENKDKYEATNDNKLTCVKTGRNLSYSKTTKQKLSSTRRHSNVIRRSVRRMNKFSQSEKNIKVVLGLLSGEIPLCKSKRISKGLDRAILHLRKAHKRVQKSLQIVTRSGRCNATEKQAKQNIQTHNVLKRKRQNGKTIDATGKQAESVKNECGDKQILQIPNSSKVVVSEKYEKRSSPVSSKCFNIRTEVSAGISAKGSLLDATSDNSPSPKKCFKSSSYTSSVVLATESSTDSPSVKISDLEKTVPVYPMPKSTTDNTEISTEKCQKSKKDNKESICTKKTLLQPKKHYSCPTKIKGYKQTTNSACEKNEHNKNNIKWSMLTTAKKTEVSRLLLGKLSKILQNAGETHNLKRLRDCQSLCRKILPIFIKSFEKKQKCTWRDVIIDRKMLFSHQLKTCFRSTLQPEAVESFLELQMMIEVIQFIENRIRFIEGRPTFRSLLWYDKSLYRELLAGEAGYQQQSHVYKAFQEKLNDSAVITLKSHSSRLLEFLQEIDDTHGSYYVYLKYKRELRECEDVLKHDCDHSAFSLSIPFSCGAHLGDTVEDLAALQKSTLEIISRFIQLPKVDPGLKEHALCLLEIISAKIDFLKTSMSLSMNLSLFGIEHLLFDAAKMMVLNESKALKKNKKIVLTKDIIGKINSSALSKLYEVICVSVEETWMDYDTDELCTENLNPHISLSSHKDKFIVGKIIDQARHAEPSLLKQMIFECQMHLDSQIKNFEVLQKCDIEKVLIKASNVQELIQRKDVHTTLLKAEAVKSYIELVMTYETLHFLYCLMATKKKQATKRGLLWYESSLLPDVVKIQKKLASFLTGTTMPSAINTIESKIVEIKSELEVVGNCSDSVNYTYAFQIMTRELSELSELKNVIKLNSAINAYIDFSPCVASLHYGSLSSELDYNYRQFSDFLGILMSSPKKDLGKMAHTMKIMKTIELAKALNDKSKNSFLELITCQILQSRINSDNMVNKTPNGSKPKIYDQSPRKRKCTSPEALPSKKEKVRKLCEQSSEKEKKEKAVFQSSTEPSFDINVSQSKESQSPVEKHCMKTSANDGKAFVNASSKCWEKNTEFSLEISKSIQKSTKPCSASKHSLSPKKASISSPNQSAASSIPKENFCSTASSKSDQNRADKKDTESLTATTCDPKVTSEPSDISDSKASTEKETFLDKLSKEKDFTTMDKSSSDIRPLNEQDCQENAAGEKKQDDIPPNEQKTQSNFDKWNNLSSANCSYPQYPGSSNAWQQSSYLWYQLGAQNNAVSQAFSGASYDAQNINPYNQASGFPVLTSYSTSQPYSNLMGQTLPQGYSSSGLFGANAPYNYSAPCSTSNQNSVPVPYSYSSTMMAGWSWNSWQ